MEERHLVNKKYEDIEKEEDNFSFKKIKDNCDALKIELLWDVSTHTKEKIYFSEEMFFIKILPSSIRY